MNDRSTNKLISKENSDELVVKEAIIVTSSSQGLLDVRQTSTRSTYELFSWLISYTSMFAVRLTKDIFISVLGYFYSGQLLPNHIVHLINVQNNNFAESESHTVTCSREHSRDSVPLFLIKWYNAFKSYILSSEDDYKLQCTSKDLAIGKVERERFLIIVDSRCINNSNIKEMPVDTRPNSKKFIVKKDVRKNISSIDMPSTSKYYDNGNKTIQLNESEFMDELEVNTQKENVIPLNEDNNNESIVTSYLKNRDTLSIEGTTVSNKKRTSLLENVRKMETILEGEQYSSFPCKKLSETSLDVYIPSYPGSPRSLHVGSRYSLLSFDDRHPKLKQAVDFLHSDNDFLVAAEIGDDKLLEIILSKGPNLQQTDHLGRNALHLAMCSGSERAITLLLKAGVNPNVKDKVGTTPLSLCLMRSPSIKIINLLFDYGAVILPRLNPTDTGLFLQFIIMCIPTEEEETIIRLLVEKGALLNDPEAPAERQALHFAAMSNNRRLIEILLELGANLYEVNHRNETAREVAVTFRCEEALMLLEEMEEEHECNVLPL